MIFYNPNIRSIPRFDSRSTKGFSVMSKFCFQKSFDVLRLCALGCVLLGAAFPVSSYAQDGVEDPPSVLNLEDLGLSELSQDQDTQQDQPESTAQPLLPEEAADEAGEDTGMLPDMDLPQEVNDPQVPGDAALSVPQEPAPVAEQAAMQLPDIPDISEKAQPEENLFFDAESLVPQSEMAAQNPKKLNPRLQPASRLMIVNKTAGAGARQAKIVSAERALSLGRYNAALSFYNEVYEKNPRDPNALLGRAIAYQKLGQEEAAISAYEELLDARPDNVEAQINMIGLVGKRYPAVAMRQLMDLRQQHPDSVGVVAQLAVLSSEIGQYQEALDYLGMAASLEPHNASHLFNMAVTADRAGDKKNAVDYYEQALEIDTIYGGGRSIPREAVFERLATLR